MRKSNLSDIVIIIIILILREDDNGKMKEWNKKEIEKDKAKWKLKIISKSVNNNAINLKWREQKANR